MTDEEIKEAAHRLVLEACERQGIEYGNVAPEVIDRIARILVGAQLDELG